MEQLTADERKWLINLLENLQLQGPAKEVRQVLAMADSIQAKLKDTGKEKESLSAGANGKVAETA